MIEPLQKNHVPEVVRIHRICFPESDSTKLGDAFLRGYYRGHCESSHAAAFVSLAEGRVAGFIAGGVNSRTLSREIIGNSGPGFLWSLIVNTVRHPVRSIRKYAWALKSFVLPKRKTFYSDETSGLASIAVLPEYRGKGLAEEMTRVFLDELRRRGNKACRLNVEAGNARAKGFYEKIGFVPVNSEATSYIYFFDEDFKTRFLSTGTAPKRGEK